MPPDNNNPGAGGNAGGQGGGTPPSGEDILKKLAVLDEQVKAQKAENDSLKEDLKRTNALLEAAWVDPNKPDPNKPDPNANRGHNLARDYTPLGVPNEAAAAIIEEAKEIAKHELRKEYDERQQQERSSATARDQFYKENPELVGHERIVISFANDVQREFPHMKTDQAFKEVAKRAREYVSSKFTPSGGTPPPILSGAAGGKDRPLPGSGKDDDFKFENPDDAIKDEMEERSKARRAGLRG